MNLGDLLVALHGSDPRYHSVRCTYRIRSDLRHATAAGASMRTHSQGTLGMAGSGTSEVVLEVETLISLWREGGRVREERRSAQAIDAITIGDGELWWHWRPGQGATTNEHDPTVPRSIATDLQRILEPSTLLGTLTFEVIGDSVVAGRRSITASAHPRSAAEIPIELAELGSGADHWRFEVDAERGVLLTVAAHYKGRPFRTMTAEQIAFDEPIKPSIFVFSTPDGTVPHAPLRPQRPKRVSITEAQRLADFPILRPSRVPDDWSMQCTYSAPSHQFGGISAGVTLDYRSDSADQDLRIALCEAAHRHPIYDELTAGENWHEQQHASQIVRIAPRSGPAEPQTQAYIERGGTFAFLTSETLTDAEVASYAFALTPAGAN